MISYAVLLCLALVLNVGDRRMLVLTALVGAGVFAPVPAPHFYLICMLGEALIALAAHRIAARASRPVVQISTILVAFHALGWWLNGYPVSSPYHVMVQICEHAELAMCILLSNKFTREVHYAARLR
jgi:hypothetical protein